MTLAQMFAQRLREACEESAKLGHNPTRILGMLTSMDAVSVAKNLIMSGDIQTGLKKMVSIGRQELTIESLMLESKFAPLFTKQELDAAKWRLSQVMAEA